MQLLALGLYGPEGAFRKVEFTPGKLNIVTGESQTGKTSLIAILDYCMGRDDVTMPVSEWFATVRWYAALFVFENGTRAVVARPTPRRGAKSNSQAMLAFGADLDLPDAELLRVNADTATVRSQLGRLIGLDDDVPVHEDVETAGTANLGNAVMLCLQPQNEIGNPAILFHRQAERDRIAQSIRDTLPYFLGAVPRDQAARLGQLRSARRDLQRLEVALAAAETAARTIDSNVRALMDEARGAGLLPDIPLATRDEALAALRAALSDAPQPAAQQDGRLADLQLRRQSLADSVQALNAERRVLINQTSAAAGYDDALSLQAGRLLSLGLLTDINDPGAAPSLATVALDDVDDVDDVDDGSLATTDDAVQPLGVFDAAEELCPVCGHDLTVADHDVTGIRQHLRDLTARLVDVQTAEPARRRALTEIDEQLAALREELGAANRAVAALDQSRQLAEDGRVAFVRGRITASLTYVAQSDQRARDEIRGRRNEQDALVRRLEAELDEAGSQERLSAAVAAVSTDMTDIARTLQLEHAAQSLYLDLTHLTVAANTTYGRGSLRNFGSGENWVGYHMAAHLALHRFFTVNERPVPRILIMDQVEQAYFSSAVGAQRRRDVDGTADDADTDFQSVQRMFRMFLDWVDSLETQMQLIICTHVNITDQAWFADAVVHDWREGRALIPDEWIALDAAGQS